MIEAEHLANLRNPIVLAAFEGWNDAGECSTAVIEHLMKVWKARHVATMDPEDFYDFQVNRPRTHRVDGQRRLQWPSTSVYLATDTPLDRDVLLILGIEPSVRWRTFATQIVSYLARHEVQLLLTLGGMLADVPHTRPMPVSLTSEDRQLLTRADVDRSGYEGPTGIVGVICEQARELEIPAASAWAAVPHYAGGPPSPKATLALVGHLEEFLGCVIDDADLIEQARAWERGVDELASSDEEVADYVQSLEEAQDTADLPEASGDAIAREFERYLRRRGEDETQS